MSNSTGAQPLAAVLLDDNFPGLQCGLDWQCLNTRVLLDFMDEAESNGVISRADPARKQGRSAKRFAAGR